MASQKQLDANRRNAQKSTGPRTLAGKARSRLNAIRDNLTGQITTLSQQDRPAFEQFRTRLMAGFNPKTVVEEDLAQSIAWDTWRLNRLRAVETNIYTLGLLEDECLREGSEEAGDEDGAAAAGLDDMAMALSNAQTFRSESRQFDLMSLYEQRMNRSIHRNIMLLRDMQAERRRLYESDRQEEILLARLHEFNEIPIQAAALPSKNGFNFSNEEIAVAAVRQRHVDTAKNWLKTTNPSQLYGTLRHGCGDSHLLKTADNRPVSAEEHAKIQSVPPHEQALRRLSHPEEFYAPPPARQ